MCRPPSADPFVLLSDSFSMSFLDALEFRTPVSRAALFLVPGALGAAMPTTQSATQATPPTPPSDHFSQCFRLANAQSGRL